MESPFASPNFSKSQKNKISWRKNLKLWTLAGGVFLIGSAAFIFWPARIFTADKLISLAPVDSILYLQAGNSFFGQKNQISDLPIVGLASILQGNDNFVRLDFKNDLLNNSNQAALIVLADYNSDLSAAKKLDYIFLFDFKNESLIKSVLPKLKDYLVIDKNVLAIATDKLALAKIQAVKDKKTFSLLNRIDQSKVKPGLLNLYLDSANLKFYLATEPTVLNTIFTRFVNQDIYLALKSENDLWRFKMSSEILYSLKASRQKYLVEYLPKDFSLFVSGINLFDAFQQWGKADSNVVAYFKQLGESVKNIYHLNFNELAEELLNQPADLVILKNKNSFLGQDFILILSPPADSQISGLQNLVKIMLAQKRPKSSSYKLPDGSKVIELMADPEVWQWQKENLNDAPAINYLREPALNFEIGYAAFSDKIIISNSMEALKSFMANQDINLKDLTSRCSNGFWFNDLIIFNAQAWQPVLSPYLVLFSENRIGKASGCFFRF
ncbi:MAG: hypothetical protein WCX08_01760 [Candidatus Buchananbacteria bacterium]